LGYFETLSKIGPRSHKFHKFPCEIKSSLANYTLRPDWNSNDFFI
jgi:hypothetical protein